MTAITLKKILEFGISNWSNLLSSSFAFATLIISCKVFKEQVNQRKLSIMPSLRHSTKSSQPSKGPGLYLTNNGHDIAMNISIQKICFPDDKRTYFKFNSIDMIRPGEEVELHLEYTIGGKKMNDPLMYLFQFEKDNDFITDIVFHFETIEGRKYKQKNRIGKGRYNHGKVTPLKTGFKKIL